MHAPGQPRGLDLPVLQTEGPVRPMIWPRLVLAVALVALLVAGLLVVADGASHRHGPAPVVFDWQSSAGYPLPPVPGQGGRGGWIEGLDVDPDAPHELLLSTGSGAGGSNDPAHPSLLWVADRDTGHVLQGPVSAPGDVYGESAAFVGAGDQHVRWLSWTHGIALDYRLPLIATAPPRMQSLPAAGPLSAGARQQGWGMCTMPDGTVLTSDGTASLAVREPADLRVRTVLEARIGTSVQPGLNELACPAPGVSAAAPAGLIWANVWPTAKLAGIDPASGAVRAVFDVTPLVDAQRAAGTAAGHDMSDAVANGVALVPGTGAGPGNPLRIYVTGKRWDRIYELTLAPRAVSHQ